ncbi:MAG TPA: hypothetical protein VE548_01790 [Nitrososphaeraceae archaeon]|jgi:hypothetical protein|nr:hypothetical protein [Nitrososphaeraceae archaeon]
MQITNDKTLSTTSILRRISDEKTLLLFNNIALSTDAHSISPKKLQLSVKQYYSRTSGLINAGLVKRSKGKHSLTYFGKIVYDVQLNIATALNYYWKMKAIESIQTSVSPERLPKEEMSKLVDALIDNHKIKDTIFRELLYSSENDQSITSMTTADKR